MTCTEATLTGQLPAPGETVDLEPAYKDCKAFGFTGATVTTEGCSYRFHAGEEAEGEEEQELFAATMDIVCEEEAAIVIVGGTCEVQIGSQEGLGAVQLRNNLSAEPIDVTPELSLTGILYTKTKDGFLCPLSGTGEGSDGTLAGDFLAGGSRGEGEEKEEVAFVVQKRANTRLCEDAACKTVYKKGTAIEAVSTMSLVIDLEGSATVKCASSKITGTTNEEQGAPLLVGSFKIGAEECTVSAMACTNVAITNSSNAELFAVGPAIPSLAHFMVHNPDLVLECPGIKCEYQDTAKPISVGFSGGTPKGKMIIGSQVVPKKTKPGEEMGCSKNVIVATVYNVEKPAPVWPSS